MPIKLNLVLNRGQYNQDQNPNIKINNNSYNNPPVADPPGISMRRTINTPKTGGCNSCGN